MPRNFLEGCEAAAILLEEVPNFSADDLDLILTQANITPDSDAEELVPIQARTGIGSLAAIEAAETAESCKTCKDLGECSLGMFLGNKL